MDFLNLYIFGFKVLNSNLHAFLSITEPWFLDIVIPELVYIYFLTYLKTKLHHYHLSVWIYRISFINSFKKNHIKIKYKDHETMQDVAHQYSDAICLKRSSSFWKRGVFSKSCLLWVGWMKLASKTPTIPLLHTSSPIYNSLN